MKLLRALAAVAALFVVPAAQAQNAGTVTLNAFAIGNGPGAQGFKTLLCTGFAVGTGAGSAPTCRVIASADIPASVALTGAPTAPTAAVDTNTTQLATTAFMIGQASAVLPVINGTAAIGTSLRYARADHVHPTDTTRAPLASPAFTGVPTAPTAGPRTNTTQLATTAYVDAIGVTTLSFQQSGTGSVSQTIDSIFKQTTRATDFGVKCDGVTDDLASINKVIAAAAAGSIPTRVQFPAGTCRITGTIAVASNYVMLVGAGALNTTIYRDFANGPDISFNAASNAAIYYTGVQGFSFIRNMATTPGTSDTALVKCVACNNFYFRDIQGDNIIEGLQLVGGAFFYLERLSLVGQYAALGGSHFGIKGETLTSPGTGATAIPTYVWMDASWISGPLNSSFAYGIWITAGENWNIAKTYVGQSKFHNMLIEQGSDNANIIDIQVNNSYIDSAGLDGVSITGSGVPSGETWNGSGRAGGNGSIPIRHVNFDQVSINSNGTGTRNGFTVNGTARGGTFSQALNDFHIVNCNVVAWLGSGIRLDGGSDVVIVGNTVRGNNFSNTTGGLGILIGAPTIGVNVTGNRIGGDVNGQSATAFQAAGIGVSAGATNYTIIGNDVRLNTSAISSGSTSGVTFANNDGSGSIGAAGGDLGGTYPNPTISNATVSGKLLTGYASGAGTVSAGDTILAAIQKLNGNDALKAPLASPALTGVPTAPTAGLGTNTTQLATTAYVDRTTRERLTASRTYFVLTTGSDSNTGLLNTAGGAFLTIQRAINAVAVLDIGTNNVLIQVGAGTYTGPVSINGPWLGSGSVTLQGDVVTPSNVVISVTSATDITLQNNAQLNIAGFKLQTTTSGSGIISSAGSVVTITGLMTYGPIVDQGLYAAGGQITMTFAYNITGGGAYHMYASGGGVIVNAGNTITLTGTPAWSGAFSHADTLASVISFGQTYVGTGTGKRYEASLNSVINTSSGANPAYYPLPTAGTALTGSQYQ